LANFPIINNRPKAREKKPPWLKVRAPQGPRYNQIRERLRELNLFTVCEEAHCPNIGECWDGGTATIMLMGEICTRGCRFCAVTTGKPPALDPLEPQHAADTVVAMDVDYIVLTSVNRDDLEDGGANHFARTVVELKTRKPEVMVEVLVPDFQGRLEAFESLFAAGPEVIAHNVETIPRLTRRVRDARATFDQSMKVLSHVVSAGKGRGPGGVDILAKTSVMCGIGETPEEIRETMVLLREAGVHVVTFGQYLRPSQKHLEVHEYVTPEQFDQYAEWARELGFLYVASGPLVRSSYRAGEFYIAAQIKRMRAEKEAGTT
jgi:lipoic acid synthetase